jgi:cephalosporin-C deacetylase-like acetyl esterase
MTMNGCGPVYPETLMSGGKKGYAEWLADCVSAVEWARREKNVIPDRVSFFGTSQGGGASLLLASIYSDEHIVKAVAAEEPFLTDFAVAAGRGAYGMGADMYADTPSEVKAAAEFFVDTMHHVHRISCPVLLTSGGKDETCPPETVKDLFDALGGTKSYTHFDYLPHGYSREFLAMVKAWFMMFA